MTKIKTCVKQLLPTKVLDNGSCPPERYENYILLLSKSKPAITPSQVKISHHHTSQEVSEESKALHRQEEEMGSSLNFKAGQRCKGARKQPHYLSQRRGRT